MSELYIRPMFLRGEGELKHKLYIACENGNVRDVKRFVDDGAKLTDDVVLFEKNQNIMRCHPLLAALQSGNVDVIKYLIQDCAAEPHCYFYEEFDQANNKVLQKYDGALLMLATLKSEIHGDLL